MNPKISIIVVNFNGGDKVVKSVASVMSQKYTNKEIVIVDNGSVDGSIEKISKLSKEIKIIKLDKNYGYTVGCNTGVKNSTGNYVLLLNNDAYLNQNFLQDSVTALEKSGPHICGLFPKIVFNWEPSIINSTFVTWHHKFMWYDQYNGTIDPAIFDIKEKPQEVFGAMFVAPIFKREIFTKIGLFDEKFFSYGEDFDVSYKLNIFGYKFIYDPNITACHDFRSSSKEDSNPLWSRFYFLRNYLMVIFINYQFKNILSKFFIYTSFIRNDFLTSIKTRNIPLFLLNIKVVFSFISLLPHIIKQRSFVQKERKIDDKKVWSRDFAVSYNPFFYNSKIVLNMDNLDQSTS